MRLFIFLITLDGILVINEVVDEKRPSREEERTLRLILKKLITM